MGYRKLGRRCDHRKMLLRNIVTSFLREGRLTTTEPRAKELRRIADEMITLAKRGDLHARRQALAYLLDEDVVTKLFKEIGPRYADRQGGYTRLVKVGYRRGDGAPLVMVELV
ncbi:MAG: 50S ribosomal protein L17 [Thermanaeromonas sp.]|uniref:50S ribosomal protein L17 n=1 Tax=Thermanaeromonas sp. TaxID=2003697 RepID=UPI00243E84BA|nr:50S ribosomal protein L17 [Thermanaeromonas sp.]MCG0277390.1 50S ribosomal protein L17 [Thermanaeromonas sp.]